MKVTVVGGLGRIGLVLSAKLASLGHEVYIFDTDEARIQRFLEDKEAVFFEPGLDGLIYDAYKNMHIVRECVPYDVEAVILATSQTDLSQLFTQLDKKFHKVLVRQTVNMGDLDRYLGRWDIAYIPERIAQGKALQEIDIIPQIIGTPTYTKMATHIAEQLFTWVDTVHMRVNEAVFLKLATNFYRYATFAIANEIFLASQQYPGIDFTTIRDSMRFKYPRMKAFPMAGWSGGFCLPKDTKYLVDRMPIFAHGAIQINEISFIEWLSDLICSEVKAGRSVGLLGISAMPDVDDFRGSLRDALFPVLEARGNPNLYWHDPFSEHNSSEWLDVVINCQTVIVGIPHKQYRSCRIPQSSRVIDPWGIYER